MKVPEFQPEKSRDIVKITVALDRDVLEYFRKDGPGYQTRMNAVLRSFVEARRGKDAPKP